MEILGELKWTDSVLALEKQGVFIDLNPGELKYCIVLKRYASDDQSIKLLVPLNTILKEQNKIILESEAFISQEKGFITAIELVRTNDEKTIAHYFLSELHIMTAEELNLLFTLPPQTRKLNFSAPSISQSILQEQPLQLKKLFESILPASNLKADKLELIGLYYDGLENIYCLAVTIPNQTLHLFTYNLNPFARNKFKNKYVGEIKEKSNHFQAAMASCDKHEISWYILTDTQLLELTASPGTGPLKNLVVLYKKNYVEATLFTINAWPCTIKGKSFTHGGAAEQADFLTFSRNKPLIVPFLNFYCIIGGLSTQDSNIEYLRLPYYNKKGWNYSSNKNATTSFSGFTRENWELYSFRDIKENYNTWYRAINFSANCACVLNNKILIFNAQSFENNEETGYGGYFYSYEPITAKWQRYCLVSPFHQQEEESFFSFPESEKNKNNSSFKVYTIRDNACIAFLDYKKAQGQISLSLYQLPCYLNR